MVGVVIVWLGSNRQLFEKRPMSLERLTAKLKGRSGAARMLSSYFSKPRFFS